jgi:hypothetical protein
MTLENTLRTKLTDPVPGQPEVVVAHHGWAVALRPQAHDTLGCALDELRLERQGAAAGGEPRAWAERISRTVTGLLEPLKLIEVDSPRDIALLRSAAPTPGENDLRYYEVELHGTRQASVHRYRGYQEPGRKRERIPFALTYEALAKLVGDMTAEK